MTKTLKKLIDEEVLTAIEFPLTVCTGNIQFGKKTIHYEVNETGMMTITLDDLESKLEKVLTIEGKCYTVKFIDNIWKVGSFNTSNGHQTYGHSETGDTKAEAMIKLYHKIKDKDK